MATDDRDQAAFAASFPLRPTRSIPAIRLHLAGAASRLSAFSGARQPYWAYVWAGGAALARHLLERPETVAGRRVLDLCSGSGLVAIAAAKAGAASVVANDSDPNACRAIALNAAANGVEVEVVPGNLLGGPPLDVGTVLVGDGFYNAKLAARMTSFLARCAAAGQSVLVGDPGRGAFPQERFRLVAEYEVEDFGAAGPVAAGVYALRA